jgi:hypothetical protein
MTEKNAKNLVSIITPKQVETNLMLSVINTHQISALGELHATTAANIDSASYYKFLHLEQETSRNKPLDHTSGLGFW